MTIQKGDRLPDVPLTIATAEGPKPTTSGQYFAGIACRGPGGKWIVRHHAQIERRPSALGKTVPANDPLATLAPVISRLMAGDALGPDEEAAVIAKHWRE